MNRIFLRIPAFLLCFLMLFSSIALFPAQAIEITEDESDVKSFLWLVNFENMSSIYDNKGSTEYSLSINSSNHASLVTFDGRRALQIKDTSNAYFINDVNNILDDYKTFYVEADMYFESFPTGSSGNDTAESYPMSFVTWMTQNEGDSKTSYRSIRVTHDGYLSTTNDPANHPDLVSDVQLPLKEWFKIRFAISPQTGSAEIFINGESVLTYAPGSPTNMTSSKIRFFDSRYQYSVYLSNISVCSDNNYRIGYIKEETADYFAYQTTVPENKVIDGVKKKVFNLRILAGLNSLEYNNTGYNVTVIYKKGDETHEAMKDISTDMVFEAVNSGDIWTPASEYEFKYFVAIAVGDIEADYDRIEFVIRPYTSNDGIKKYGDPAILVWGGATDKEGYPVLEYSNQYVEYTMNVSTDLNIKRNVDTNFNSATLIELKNNGTSGTTTRYAYFRFDFSTLSESALSKLMSGKQIFFEFYVNGTRTLKQEEADAGGLLCDVHLTNDDWDENTITGTNWSTQIPTRKKIGQTRIASKKYCSIDVTQYVLEALKNDKKVTFELRNVENDGSGSQTTICALEGGQNVPRLIIHPIEYGHEISLGKLKNIGYEPWGYAEKLVDDWINGDRDELYAHAPYETIDLSAADTSVSNGAHTILFNKYTNNPSYDPNKYPATFYARKLSTLIDFSNDTISEFDKYGGITNSNIEGNATGYFHTEKHGKRTYIIDPLGNPFISVGFNTVQLGANQNQKDYALEKYGTADDFYEQVTNELKEIGVNTYWGGDDGFMQNGLVHVVSLGCMSGYMGNGSTGLGLSVSTGGSAKYRYNNTMNVFDPDFAVFCQMKADTAASKYLGSGYEDLILGYYSDNEIPSQEDMLLCYLTIDPYEPINAFSYATAWTYLIKMTGKPNPSTADVTPELSEEFKAFVYNTYFDCVKTAMENAGFNNYMYLGNRIHATNMTSEGYLRAASKYLDIVSANLYGGIEPPIETIKTIYKYSGKPMLVSEFFSKANDAVDANGYSLGNQANAGLIVDTQKDRATMYENYTLLLLESQNCVGWTWYRFRDNDQTIFKDANGNFYRVFDYNNSIGAISGYYNLTTNQRIKPENMPEIEVFYQGEKDTSNLGSNKGIYDNRMNLYTELADAITNISNNVFGIINYFDAMRK